MSAWMQDSSAPDAVEQADSAAMVRRVLLTLSPREERAVRLRHFAGLTYEEVGDQLDVGPQRARQIVEKAMRKLKHPSRSRSLRAALDGALPRASYPPAAPKPTPTEAQEMARRLRELAAHIEDTKRREVEQEAWLAAHRARGSEFGRWAREEAERHAQWRREHAKQHPTMGEGRCLIRIIRTAAANTDGESIMLCRGDTWLVDEQHRDDLVALGYAVNA